MHADDATVRLPTPHVSGSDRAFAFDARTSDALARALRPLFDSPVMSAMRTATAVITPDRRIARANPSATRLLGYSEAELRALPSWTGLAAPAAIQGAASRLRTAFATGVPVNEFECRLVRKDDEVITVSVAASPLVIDDAVVALIVELRPAAPVGNRPAVAEALTDAVDTALRDHPDHARMYREMLRRAADAIVVVQDDRVRWRNAAYGDRLGFDSFGQPLSSLLTPDAVDRARAAIARLESGETAKDSVSFEVPGLGGEPLLMEATLSLIEFEDAPATLAMVRDVTARADFERRQREHARVEGIARVIASAAHEFANTLRSLVPAIDDHALPTLAATIERAGRLSAALAVIGGQAVGARRAVLVSDVLRDAAERVARDTTVQLSVDRPMSVLARESTLVDAIEALITNALEAGGAPVVLSAQWMIGVPDEVATVEGSRRGYARIVVEDTGAGMDPSTLSRLFEPFFSTRDGRLGLGAPLAQTVVHSLGGELAVTSAVGEGTSGAIYLPVADDEHPAEPPATARAHTPGAVLLVDDNDTLRTVTSTVLSAAGYRVTAVGSLDAVDALPDGPSGFDALLLDLLLPDGSGLDLFERLGGPAGAPPTLFISGYGGTDLADLAPATNWSFLPKPFARQQLLDALTALCHAAVAESHAAG